jgi:hypothetical protein
VRAAFASPAIVAGLFSGMVDGDQAGQITAGNSSYRK